MEKLQRLARSLRTARAAELPSDPDEAIYILIPMIMQNQYRGVGELLGSSDLDVNRKFGKAKRTLIHIASNVGAYECLVLLLKKGGDVNCKDRSGVTPLQLAARNGHAKCIQKLVESKASVEMRNNEGMTADYNTFTVKLLLSDDMRESAAVTACKTFNEHLWPFLLSNFGDKSLVHWLASNGRTELLTDLLPYIKNIDVEDFNGQTALHVACLNGHRMTVARLLDSKAEIEKADFKGCTPLYFACSHGHARLVEDLLKCGAVLQASGSKISPLEVSFKNGYEDVCAVMVEHDLTLINSILQLSQDDSVSENKATEVLKRVCSIGAYVHQSILVGLAEMVQTCGLELLSNSSDYKSTVSRFLRMMAILTTLCHVKPSQLQTRARSDSAASLRSRIDSTSSRFLKTLGGSGTTPPPPLETNDDDVPLKEVCIALDELWNAMEHWFDLISKDMQQFSDGVVDESLENNLKELSMKDAQKLQEAGSTQVGARDIAAALLRKKPKGLKRRSVSSLDRLRLSQPALEFNLGVNEANLYKNEYRRSMSADINSRVNLEDASDQLQSPVRRLQGSAPPLYSMTLDRNLRCLQGGPSCSTTEASVSSGPSRSSASCESTISRYPYHAPNSDNQASSAGARNDDHLDGPSGIGNVSSPFPGTHSNSQQADSEDMPSGKPEPVSKPGRCFSPNENVVEASADRLCAMVHGYYVACASSLYWERRNQLEQFEQFIEKYTDVLELLVARKPQVIFEHFHFLIENPLLLQPFLSVIHSQPFGERRQWFYENLHKGKEELGPQDYEKASISVIRDTVLTSSCGQILHRDAEQLKKTLSIRFDGEAGLGEGVVREWLDLLLKELLNPDFALFTLSADGATFQPNSNSFVNPDHLNYFRFAGQIMGLALYHKQLVNAYFTRSFYKHILGIPVSYSDVASIDPQYANSLQWILDTEINNKFRPQSFQRGRKTILSTASPPPPYHEHLNVMWILDTEINNIELGITFSVESDVFGQVREVDLKPNGKTIPVTDENKHEYVQLAADLRMTKAIKPQIYSFLDGFHQFVPHSLVALFDEYELEIMLSGIPEIDLEDWRKNTSYSGYDENSQVISWFWDIVQEFDQKRRVNVLQFATGSSRVPWGGFSNLSGASGKQKFTISAGGEETRLPTASTCFNLLKLPDYRTKEELKRSLEVALDCGRLGFEFA